MGEIDLAAVVPAWPDLPAAVRAGIVAMVNASKPATAARMAQDKPERLT